MVAGAAMGPACSRHKVAASPMTSPKGGSSSKNGNGTTTKTVIGCELPPHLAKKMRTGPVSNGPVAGSILSGNGTSGSTEQKLKALTPDDPAYWLEKCLHSPLRLRYGTVDFGPVVDVQVLQSFHCLLWWVQSVRTKVARDSARRSGCQRIHRQH